MRVKVKVDVKSLAGGSLHVVAGANDTVGALKERIASLSLVPFPDQVLSLDAVPLPEEAALHQCGVQEGSSLVLTAIASADAFLQQLEELLKDGISVDELALLYCYKHGVSAAQTLQALGLGNKLQDFLSSHGFPLQGNAVYARVASEISQPTSAASRLPEDNQKYLDLHNSLCSRAFNSKVAKALAEHLEELTQLLRALPLDIARVVTGGSMGKGTGAGVCPADAEVVFFINTFAPEAQWLHQLLPAVAALLSRRLKVTLAQDAVLLSSSPPVPRLELRFAAERSYRQAKAMAKHDPQAWRWQTSFVEQRVRFVARQPGSVKATIRLLKWWRNQQEWSAPIFQPSDEILELTVIHAAQSKKAADQREAIVHVLDLLSSFQELRVIWTNFYSQGEIWGPLLLQRPLVMDPANPCANLARPEVFQCCELMQHARSTHFFW